MPPQIEVTIPTTSISSGSSPYTIYNIHLQLPLRAITVQKRYSDFTNLHTALANQVGSPPSATLPSKSWFSRTVSSPALTEDRRKGLEAYLQAINDADDARWRNSSAWRAFLNLPSSTLNSNSSKPTPLQRTSSGGAAVTDANVWLDVQADVKAQLHDARLHLTRRDQAATPQKQHEASANAKACLVKAGSMIVSLESGLKSMSEGGGGWGGGSKLGDGEIRRRKDLVASARKEKEGLDNLLNAMVTKAKLDSAVASIQDKEALVGGGAKPKAGGRVLGKETSETRELDNEGVLQLQKQKMQNQDVNVDELRKIVAKQKELGVAINEELEVQNEMLKMVDEDVERVEGKIKIAKKRIGKIS